MNLTTKFVINHCDEELTGVFNEVESPHGLRLEVKFDRAVGPEKYSFKGGNLGGSMLIMESGVKDTIISLAGYHVECRPC